MELAKTVDAPPLEFHYADSVLLVKPHANEEDRMALALSKAGPDRCRAICRAMVIGWRNVKRDGRDAPFDFEDLANFPRLEGKNLFLELGAFIIERTDLSRGVDRDLKKDSAPQPVGEPVTAH